MIGIKSKHIITSEKTVDGVILINAGKIVDVVKDVNPHELDEFIDAGELAVMAGMIDPHVHINEPGRTEWEGFETATKAAAAGGITTLIDMPLNSTPVTTNVKNLNAKLDAARKGLYVNCGFYGGIVPNNLDEIEPLLKSGVFGIKAFLTHSGIDDFPNTEEIHLRHTLAIVKKYNLPLLVHCELSEEHPNQQLLQKNPGSYKAYLASRPKWWEDKAIKMMIDLCRETGAHVHIVHLSSADSIPQIIEARKEGLHLTVETGPHYLFFNAEMISDRQTIYKCAPPIREKANNEKLWKALDEKLIDFLATDHSPAPPEIKEITTGDFSKAWGGIAGLQFSLPSVWKAASERGFGLHDLARWFCEGPAKFLGLEASKGKIEKGMDADLFLFDPNTEFVATELDIHHRHKISPYTGYKLKGKIVTTFVGGVKVFDQGKHFSKGGKVLLRNKV